MILGVGGVFAGLVAGAFSLGVLTFMFVPLERAFPARRSQPIVRPGLLVDALFFFGQYAIWNAIVFAALSFLQEQVGARVPGGLRAAVAEQPAWMQAIAAVALGDLLVYWFHRASHAWGLLWRFHAVHHTAEHLDWLAAHREHPVDGLCTALAANLPAFVMGFETSGVAALITFRATWAIFVHSNVRLPLGPLRFLLGAPELHRWHHARVERTRHNFANLAPWLDVLFGTYHRPDPVQEEAYPLGVTEPTPSGYGSQLLHPFVSLGRAAGALLAARLASRGGRSSDRRIGS